MVQLYCKLCLQSTPSTNWKTHITQKEHLQQLPLKILVRGLQKEKIDEVYAYFGRFGGIRSQNIIEKGDVVAIEYRFWDARVYCDVIHSEHTILGQDVEICWYKKPKTGNLQLVVQDEKMENEKFTYRKLALIEATKPPPKFADQLTVFQTHLQTIQDKLKETRQEIHADLTAALTPTFPYNKLHFFGSSITNLDLPDSCLDIYLDNTDSSAATLDQIKALISDGNFTDAGVVIREVPLLQFKHKTSKISCVLSTKNELPVGQSELMKFYQSLNEKVKDLMLVVKFWADCHALRHGEGFSGYALNLMVIFYLQQEPYKLPSVFDLQKESPCDEIDGWNCAFGPVEFTDSLQSATILDLLVGFFQFYGNFDYGKRVISVFSGSGIDKSCFIKPDDLPECFQDYFNQENAFVVTDGVCIQDPFVHCENVTVTVPLSSPGKLAGACRKSLQISREGETELLSKFLLFSGSNEFFVNNFDETTLKNLLLKILEDVCCCEVTATSSDGEAFYHATGEYNVWEKRVEMSKKLAHESNIMAYETAITSLVKNFAQTQSWSLTITMRLEPLKARVEFKGSDGFSVLPHLEHFIYVTLKASLQDGAIKTEVEAEEEIKQENEDVEVIVLDQTNEDIEVPEDVKLERVEDESSDDPLDMAGTSQASETNCDTNWPDVSTLPIKSRKVYQMAYYHFKTWCASKQIDTCSESTLLQYFSEKSLHHKSSTMWAHYSMLKASLSVQENIDISSFKKITAFLKRNSVGFCSKSAKGFTRRDIERFLIAAPDKTYLLMKVALIMGICGGCRCEELTMLRRDDIEDTGAVLIVRISSRHGDRTFTIIDRGMVEIYRKYVALRMPHTKHRRLFVKYQYGKCSIQPVGVHTFGRIPSVIAKFLQLEEPQSYTGRSFRKSSVALQTHSNVDIISDTRRKEVAFVTEVAE